MPFKKSTLGNYYSKIYDFNAKERFNLSSGTIELPGEQQPPKSFGFQNSVPNQLLRWFALLFMLLVRFQCG